jgi:predicted RNA-binding protein YlqC (UPF0109 family)
MAASIDQQFIEYIVKSLVNNPDEVKIERRIDEKGVLLELTVAQDDLGRVIGKRGATAQSLRTLLRALGTKNDARYNLKIVDVGGPRPPRSDSVSDSDSAAADDSGTPDDSADAADDTKSSAADEPESPPDEGEPEDVGSATDDDTTKIENKETLTDRTRKELAELDDLDV